MSDLKTMMLVTMPYTPTEKSFMMIPVTADCPYTEIVYWKDKKVLEIHAPFKKQEYAMYPKLDDNGDTEKRKQPVKTEAGEVITDKRERRITEVQQKYYIIEQVEIIAFIEALAINAKTVDYMSLLTSKDAIVEAPKPSIIMP
jgi:hypothetical protein